MTIYIGHTRDANRALRVAASRGAVHRLVRRVYSDDFERAPEAQIRDNLLGILGRLLPDWHLSYGSAVTLAPVEGYVFMSGSVRNYRRLFLLAIDVVRQADLPHPEVEWLEAPTLIGTTLDTEPEVVRFRVSGVLQAVFECLTPARRFAQKKLPQERLIELVHGLSESDRARAPSFASRNGLERYLETFEALAKAADAAQEVVIARPKRLEVYFYGWEVGELTALGSREFRFEYAPSWQLELSRELVVLPKTRISYEGPRLPAFFENLLPEGWTEGWLRAAHKIAREDVFALLSTTPKYLSNLTLRPPGFSGSELVFDAHTVRLTDFDADHKTFLTVRDAIGVDPETRDLWLALRNRGAVRISGIQPKLPVSLSAEGGQATVRLGDWRTACTHILKFQSPTYPNVVEVEWATMELAQQVGLLTAQVRIVEFDPASNLRGPALLIERFDIPDGDALEMGGEDLRLALLEDACSLLLLHREEKYDTSLERVETVLRETGLSSEESNPGLWAFLKHVLFSWIVGNGDLHAKNISIVRWFRPGRLGSNPSAMSAEYSPVYDLINTRLFLPGDQFALTINGRRDRLRLRDFHALAARWSGSREVVDDIATAMATALRAHLPAVLDAAQLPGDWCERYRVIVENNLAALRL